ncbi:hypothetical protein C8J56DRAFT_831919 [Mycena floridula]|nr:hypothetical protein C8J56DRAFT_831919 [Mycena floridula]
MSALLRRFLAFSLLCSSVWALTGDHGCGPYICLNATVRGDTVTYEITPVYRTRHAGWVGLGFGKHMKGSHMMILWQNHDDSITLSQRYAKSHLEPQVEAMPPRVAQLTTVTSTSWQPDNATTFAFEVSLNKTQWLSGESAHEQLIWAYGLVRPRDSNPHAELTQHFRAGGMVINLTKQLPMTDEDMPQKPDENITDPPTRPSLPPIATPPATTAPFTSHETLVAAHGFLVSLGFLVLLPFGSLFARWARTFTPKWFKVHQMFNFYVSLPVIAIGWLLGPAAVIDAQARHLFDAHQICGFVILFLYLSQVYLGRYIHGRRALPKKSAHPPSNVLHAAFGIVLMTLAFFQVRSGISEWEMVTGRSTSPVLYLFWKMWAVVLAVVYLVGLVLLPRQFTQEKNGVTPADYIALSTSPSPNLVFDADGQNGVYGELEGVYQTEKEEDVALLPHAR